MAGQKRGKDIWSHTKQSRPAKKTRNNADENRQQRTRRSEYPGRVFMFDPDAAEFEAVEPLPVLWYAVQADSSDGWSTGSFDREKAFAMAKKWNYKLIAVIAMGADPVCI